MRVIHAVRSDAFAGVERYIATVAVELASRGHDVSVIGGAEASMPRALGPVDWTPAPSTVSVVRALRAAGSMDVLHVHMTAAELAACVALPFRRPPVVATRHFAKARGHGPGGVVVRAVVRSRLAAELAISEFVARSVDGSPLVLHNGVPDHRPLGRERTQQVVVLNRLEAEKDVDTVIRAWARSALPRRGWRLVIAGRGALQQELQRAAQESGHGETIDFLGFVDDPSALLRSASALVTAAPLEPFGLAVAEAMAVATPVLAADGGAHPELLGRNGWMFLPGDSSALAALLEKLADDPAAALQYGRAMRERQQALYGLGRHVDGLEAVYSRIVKASQSGRPAGPVAARGRRGRRLRTRSVAR